MKPPYWIGVVVTVVILSLIARSSTSRKRATQKYFTDCFQVIEAGTRQADQAWTKSGKWSELEATFQRAANIVPPDGVDKGGVVRMKQMLKEGREYFACADGEWTMARDFLLGFAGGAVDFSGGLGIASGALLTAKGAEISTDDAERREFISAQQELERYMHDNF